MEDTIILNTNGMLPHYEEFKDMNENDEIGPKIAEKLDELLNVKRILKSEYNYETDDAHELNNFKKMFCIPNTTKYFNDHLFSDYKKVTYFPDINNEIHEIGIDNIYWSSDGLTIEGKDLGKYNKIKICIKKVIENDDKEIFLCKENNIIRLIDIKLYPDIYATYLDFERIIEASNQIIMTYQKRFGTLEGLAFLKDEATRFIAYSSQEYPTDNLFAICFKNIMQTISNNRSNIHDETKEYLYYVIDAYTRYLFRFEKIKYWNKYLLDGYIQDEKGEWTYHDGHYSRINPLTFNHYVPMQNKKVNESCQEVIKRQDKYCSYNLKLIKNANLIKE